MANYCSNTVVFEGTPQAIEQIQQLFRAMADKENKEGCGQLPDFIDGKQEGYFFDLYFDEHTDVIDYQTRWSPNIEIVQAIAEHYDVEFQLDYEQMSDCVYGRALFADKLLTDIYLEDEDFEQYQFDEETDTYHFEGKEYDSDSEILETLLDRKIAKHFKNIKNREQ